MVAAPPPPILAKVSLHRRHVALLGSNVRVYATDVHPDIAGLVSTSKDDAIKLPASPLSSIDDPTLDSTGTSIWPGSLLLSLLVAREGRGGALAGWRVVELGAGTGLCGLAAAEYGARCLLSDGSTPTVALLEHNIEERGGGEGLGAMELLWGREADAKRALGWLGGGPADLVLAADVVYMDSSLGPLMKAFSDLLPWREAAGHGFSGFKGGGMLCFKPRGVAGSARTEAASRRVVDAAARGAGLECVWMDETCREVAAAAACPPGAFAGVVLCTLWKTQ